MSESRPDQRPPPSRFLLLTALSVLVAETVVMLVLRSLQSLPPVTEAILDGLLLTVFVAPALYLFLLRPMMREIERRERAEAELRSMNATLERKVTERTANLSTTNEQLRLMAAELALAEEHERRRIAEGLHDLVGESLISAHLKLGLLKAALPEEPSHRVDEIRNSIKTVIDSTRAVTFQISNPLLFEVGLEAALEAFLMRLAKDQPFETELQLETQPTPLSAGIRVVLYRTVSELLVNVVKHARAKTVRLTSRRQGDRVLIAIEDDGIGFEAAELERWSTAGTGLGLFKARQRIAGIGGELTIDSTPGRGTRIEVSAPERGKAWHPLRRATDEPREIVG